MPGTDTNIAISMQNWRFLNGKKRPGDSFNDVLDRMRQQEQTQSTDDEATA